MVFVGELVAGKLETQTQMEGKGRSVRETCEGRRALVAIRLTNDVINCWAGTLSVVIGEAFRQQSHLIGKGWGGVDKALGLGGQGHRRA